MLTTAINYDIEVLPNCFTLHAEALFSDWSSTWEISEFRDDRDSLFAWFDYLIQNRVVMIGYNNIGYDYPILHFMNHKRDCTNEEIYAKSKSIINASFDDRFANIIWDRDRFAPQLDLYKLNHFDNKAKATSLKYLQINMRSDDVVESAQDWDAPISLEKLNEDLIPYNVHDVKETKRFALFCMDAIKFRVDLVDEYGIDVLNWNDTKIGENILINKIGRNNCYTRDQNGRNVKRQTPRTRVALRDVIFPYIRFEHPEFQRVHNYMLEQVLTPAEIWDGGESTMGDRIQTKGVFAGLFASVAGLDYYFGTGGIHASIEREHVQSGDGFIIRDIDVASLYPSIAIENSLAPEHLGSAFTEAYSSMRTERKRWQQEKGKKCVEANAIKLGLNGAYGKSNDVYSVLFDPKFTMTITINGQLSIAMLVEWLINVPTLRVLSANTDGISYYVHESHLPQCIEIEKRWENLTKLVLEDESYEHVFQRDVNSYVWVKHDGSVKLKGAYWTPDPLDYHASISGQQPPAWHKDLGGQVIIRAAVAAMVHGIDPEVFIRTCTNPFDFMLQIKTRRSDRLELGGQEIQRTTRYYVATNGQRMVKIAPPPAGCVVGQYKRRNGIGDGEYHSVLAEIGPDRWDERIHTKNQSRYENRETQIQAGRLVCECNKAETFSFDNVDYTYYISEAEKLIIR